MHFLPITEITVANFLTDFLTDFVIFFVFQVGGEIVWCDICLRHELVILSFRIMNVLVKKMTKLMITLFGNTHPCSCLTLYII